MRADCVCSWAFLVLLWRQTDAATSDFTCQGQTYEGALNSCPDKGSQAQSSGGNVTILVSRATNMPNRDATGPAAGVSDPYVRFTVGDIVVETLDQRNNLNPEWNQYVSLGFLGSATDIRVEIWDHDTGLEGADDLLVESSVRVPFCSTFNANYDEQRCDTVFGCQSDDSLWAMPYRKRCNETGTINFTPQLCTTTGSVCLYLTIYIVPFTAEVELVGAGNMIEKPALSAAGALTASADWTTDNDFGYPYFSDFDTLINPTSPLMTSLKGALMFRTNNAEKALGAYNSVKFWGGFNFPAFIYICRFEEDNALGVPAWITDEFSDTYLSIRGILMADTGNYFGCYYKAIAGTVKNKDGGIESGVQAFRANTLQGVDTNSNGQQALYDYNYIILAVPDPAAPREDVVEIVYDSVLFVSLSLSYGFALVVFFIPMAARFLDKIDYRVDRVSNYLAVQVLTGRDRNILAGLYLCRGETLHNIQYRSRLFHVRNIIYFILSVPFWLVLSWGLCCIAAVRPEALGMAVAFMGISLLFLWFGINLWRRSHWRISPLCLASLALAVAFFIVFLVGIVFTDPGVVQYGYALNFTALALIFGVINTVPLMQLAFKQDRSQTVHLRMVVQKMAEAVFHVKDRQKKGGEYRDLKINRILHALLGENYTVNPKVPAFAYSAALQELAADDADADGTIDAEEVDEFKRQEAWKLYIGAMFVLLIYFIFAAAGTNNPSLAFLHCLCLTLLDAIHLSMSHGDAKWNPGFMIALLTMGRVLIMGSPVTLWLLNYSACYMLYAGLLAQDLMSNFLPMLSKREAGDIAFTGHNVNETRNPDIVGTSYFNLLLISMAFASVLVVAAFRAAVDALPVPNLVVLGYEGWNVTVFGMLALCFTVIGTLMFATFRAYYLDQHGLLRGRMKEIFFLRPQFSLPRILALGTETAILITGFLVYAATGSLAVMIGAIFLPPIAVCFGIAWKVWVRNDFELIQWPRVKEEAEVGGEDPSDLEVAFSMIEDLFGAPKTAIKGGGGSKVEKFQEQGLGQVEGELEDYEEEPQSEVQQRTLKGFKLPELKVTGNTTDEIKMPPLPLKSVLRKKRQNLGIKTKMPLVKDLRSRDDALDNDKFGNEADVIDAADPWAQFEVTEKEALEEKRDARRKKALASTFVKQRSFWQNEWVVKMVKVMRIVRKFIGQAWGLLKSALVSNKVTPAAKYEEEEGEVKDDEGEGTVALFDKTSMKPGSPPKTPTSSRPGSPEKSKGEGGEGGGKNQEEGEDEENQEDGTMMLSEADLAKLPFDDAMWGGHLNQVEYLLLGCWYGGLLLVLLFGIALSVFVSPPYVGQAIWVAVIIAICTLVPVIKYFNTYTFDETQRNVFKFAAALHALFCLLFFLVYLEADVGLMGSLWVMNFFINYYLFGAIVFQSYAWYDGGFKFEDLDGDGDGRVSFREALSYLQAAPVLISGTIIFNWQLYVFVDILVGQVATLLLIVLLVAYVFVRDWAKNDFYLSPELLVVGRYAIYLTLFITFMVAFFTPANPIFAASVFAFVTMFQHALRIGQRLFSIDLDSKLFFSPFVLPVYSYDSQNQDVVNESETVLDAFFLCVIGVLWGCTMAVFYYPVNIGVALACCFLLLILAIFCMCVTTIPNQLAKASTMLSAEGIVEAANAAKEMFSERQQPINLEMRGYEVYTEKVAAEVTLSPLQRLQARTALTNAVDLMGDVRALKYVQEEEVEAHTVELADVDEFELLWYQQMWVDFKANVKVLLEMIPVPKSSGWKRHSQGTFGFKDALMEAFCTGRGPLGFLGLEGTMYRTLVSFKEYPSYEKFYPKFLDFWDAQGNDLKLVALTEDLDLISMLARVRDLDEALDFTYREETRCAVHFLLMLLVGADVKLQREQVLFQKFLRENRFRLASNGITPPPDIFSSKSFSSINIQLVAAWLNTLTVDERDRFHLLKSTFSEEQTERDNMIDTSDYEIAFEAISLQKERRLRDAYWRDLMTIAIVKRKEQRLQEFIDALQGFERQKFANRRDLWISDPECWVDLREMELYDRFKLAYFAERNDALESMQMTLIDIETAQKDARLGEYGRAYQFVDSTFQPGPDSIGHSHSDHVLGWRCAPGISEEVMLFDGGTHPDEVEGGVFKDNWLLSAINMLVAAGDFGNGIINAQIKGLFVGHSGQDGETTLLTEVGAYCVQLFRNSEWTPIIVDDLFPMRKKENWSNENRGMAGAHNKECKGLWLSLIEKAFAKYYGSYEMLERGYVHHALQDLTGCEAECIPLSSVSRGVGKRALWDSLLRYRANGYILGAGTGDSNLVDKEIQDMGIVFDAAYTIYDVRYMDGHRLLKLRNPPGDHDEWKGDWSDKSPLWSKKLKQKLGHSDAEDDNTFFIAFDDFCNVFRNLYVCKYYNTARWFETIHPGVWKASNETSHEKAEIEKLMADEANPEEALVNNTAAEDKKRARAKVDSAGGLPTQHNPNCVLENNPHYLFRVSRPTDFRISVTQFTSKVRSQLVVHPFCVMVVRSPDPTMGMRLEQLHKEEVLYSSGEPVAERTVNVYGSGLQPGLYVVLVAAYVAGMEGNFKISVLSNHRAEFTPIWPPIWMLKGERQEEEKEIAPNEGSNKARTVVAAPKAGAGWSIGRGIKQLMGTDINDDDSDDEPESEEEDD